MELVKCRYRMNCELGACGNRAEYVVRFARTGARSNLHICGDCLKEIARLAAAAAGEKNERKTGCKKN